MIKLKSLRDLKRYTIQPPPSLSKEEREWARLETKRLNREIIKALCPAPGR